MLQRARLQQRVDDGVLVAAQRERASGVGQVAGRADAVGQVGFRGGAEARAGAGGAEQLDVLCGQVRGVHGGGARGQRARLVQQLGGRQAVGVEAGLVLGGLLGEVDVQGVVGEGGGDLGELGAGHGADGVDGGADPGHRVGAQLLDPGGPGLGGAVAEPALDALHRDVDTTGQVAGVQERQPDARVRRGLAKGLAHLVGPVVQVVELPHGRHAGDRHLAVHRRGQLQVALGRQLGRDRVHGLAPRPERAAVVVRPTAQRPVERVRVGVGEPRQHHTGQSDGVTRTVRCGQVDHEAVRDVDQHTGDDALRQPGLLAPVARHVARCSTVVASATTPAAQSSDEANSSGAWLTPVGLRTNSIAVLVWAARMPAS